MIKSRLSGVIALSLVAVACGPVTAQDYCQHEADVLCDRVYECLTADQRKGSEQSLGTTAAECKQKYNVYNNIDCTSFKSPDDLCRGADAGKKFNKDNYNKCFGYLATVSCKDLTSSGSGGESACSQLCE